MTDTLDNFNQLVNQGINIYGSREKIRLQLIDFAKQYLDLQTVDFYKPSVISYIIDSLSILSANHIFYDSVIYREFFMVEAQMQESVYNLARWIGYHPPLATPSKVNVMFTIPLAFQTSYATFGIPSNFKVYANKTIFTIDSLSDSSPSAIFKFDTTSQRAKEQFSAAQAKVINNTTLSVRDSNGFFRPIYVSQDQKNASFILPFTQHEKIINQFIIPTSLEAYQFFSKIINFLGMISDIKVYVAEPKEGHPLIAEEASPIDFDPTINEKSQDGETEVPWTEWLQAEHGLYTMGSNSPEFVFIGGNNKAEIFFGNGIIGKQPKPGSKITIVSYITQGTSGLIIPHTINNADKLYYTLNAQMGADGIPIADITSKLSQIKFSVTNPTNSIGGIDTPSLPEIKRNAIVNLRSKGKLVSEMDYDDINTIMGGSFPSVESFPILKRSDIKINEIMAFTRLSYHDQYYLPEIVPTRNVKFPVIDPTFDSDGRFVILRKSKLLVDLKKYETLFNITIDLDTMMADYDYVLQDVIGSPATLYDNTSYDPYNNQFSYIPVNSIDFNVIFTAQDYSASSSSSASASAIYPLKVKVNVNHIYSPEITLFRCRMITKWGDTFDEYNQLESDEDMSNKVTKNPNDLTELTYTHFTFEIPNYLDVPEGLQRFEFIIEAYAILRDPDTHEPILDPDNPESSYTYTWQPLAQYFTDVIIRQDLSQYMKSSVTKTKEWDGQVHDYYKYDIHNVPVILSDYLDDGVGGGILNRPDNQTYPNFEVTALQNLLLNVAMQEKKMLTDFISIKFPDTYGVLNNLKYNDINYIVNSRYQTPFEVKRPSDIIFDPTLIYATKEDVIASMSTTAITRFIVNSVVPGYETNQLSSYINYIAEYFPGSPGIWHLIPPSRGMYVKVLDELDSGGEKTILAYTGNEWKDVQSFQIPLIISAKVEINSKSTMSSEKIIENIKTNLIDYFTPKMGIQKNLDRSEILTIIRNTTSVNYAELIEPEIDIRFNYDIKDLTQEQLIDYTPQYVGFNEQTIKIEVIVK